MQQEKLTILNIHASNTGAPRFIKQLLKHQQRDLDSHTILAGDFNLHFQHWTDQQDRKLIRIFRT